MTLRLTESHSESRDSEYAKHATVSVVHITLIICALLDLFTLA